jgi:hypothetical protein
MRNSFTFTAPQPTLLHLATNIISSTPKKNLPTKSDIVQVVVDSLVKAENEYIPSEFLIRYDPSYDYQTGGEPRQGADAMLALQEMAGQMVETLKQERLQDIAAQMATPTRSVNFMTGPQEQSSPAMYSLSNLTRQRQAELRSRETAAFSQSQQSQEAMRPPVFSRQVQAEARSMMTREIASLSPSPSRSEGMYRRTRGIPGRYGGVEGVPDTPPE